MLCSAVLMLKKRRKESRRGGSSCSRALATKRKPPRKKAQADGLAPLTTWPGWPHCPVTISGGLAWLAAGHKAHSHNGRRVGWLGKKKGFAKKKVKRKEVSQKKSLVAILRLMMTSMGAPAQTFRQSPPVE